MKAATQVTETEYFIMHGVKVKFSSTSEAVMSSMQNHLKYFRRTQVFDGPFLTIDIQEVHDLQDVPFTISKSARKLFSRTIDEVGECFGWRDSSCEVHRDDRKVIVNFPGQGLLVIDGDRKEVQGYLVTPELLHSDVRTLFLHFAITELMKWEGYYTIHATALEKDGRGVLIPGYSGQGKTTTFLSLLRSGYRCLSDDHPFLHANGQGVEVLAFPVKVDVTKNTVAFFPELQTAGSLLHQGIWKQYFYVDDLYPGGTGFSSAAKILLFPKVIDSPTSYVEVMPKSQALEALLPQGLLVYDPAIAKKEFQVLTQLVHQTDCYTVYCGQNVLELPNLVTPLLEKTST